MTKEETEKRIEVMQAYVDGKEIQVICRDMKTWEDVVDPNWEWGHLDYRVKPALSSDHLIMSWSASTK